MKTLLLFSLIAVCINAGAQDTKPGRVVKCISGDCNNGIGEAQMTDVDNFSGDVYYKGEFKNGLIDGEGIQRKDSYIYIGHFKKGLKNGYMTRFDAKRVDGNFVPDSSGSVAFANYTSEFGYKSIIVKPDGSTENQSRHEGHYNKNFDPFQTIKDKWINEQVTAYQAARAGKFAALPPAPPKIETMVLAVKTANTARDQWIQAIQWDCLTDRKYWIDVEAQTKYHAMPFAGHITIQVVAPDNTVAFEAEAGTYWTPRTAGKYTFLIKFYQDKILGTGAADNYVSGLRIEWSLKSRRQL